MLVWETFGKGPDNWNIVSAPNFWDFERQSRSFESMAIFDSAGRGYNLSATGDSQEAEQVSGLRVSAGFFTVLGAKPLLGRTFLPEEETLGRDHEVVLSYGLWKTRYGGDPSLVGRTIRIDGADFTVVGRDAARIRVAVLERTAPALGARGLHQDRLRPRRQQLYLDRAPEARRERGAGAGGDGGRGTPASRRNIRRRTPI